MNNTLKYAGLIVLACVGLAVVAQTQTDSAPAYTPSQMKAHKRILSEVPGIRAKNTVWVQAPPKCLSSSIENYHMAGNDVLRQCGTAIAALKAYATNFGVEHPEYRTMLGACTDTAQFNHMYSIWQEELQQC